jgi:hypothetical protein
MMMLDLYVGNDLFFNCSVNITFPRCLLLFLIDLFEVLLELLRHLLSLWSEVFESRGCLHHNVLDLMRISGFSQ